jgi:hypothetical protein
MFLNIISLQASRYSKYQDFVTFTVMALPDASLISFTLIIVTPAAVLAEAGAPEAAQG